MGLTGTQQPTSASPSPMFACTRPSIMAPWVAVKLKTEDRVEDNSILREDQEIKVFLLLGPGGTWLLLGMEQKVGEDRSRHMSEQLCSSGTESKTEMTASWLFYQRAKVFWRSSTQFFFCFCLMCKVHFTSKQERNSRNEFQLNAANIYWAPKCQAPLLYLGMSAGKR